MITDLKNHRLRISIWDILHDHRYTMDDLHQWCIHWTDDRIAQEVPVLERQWVRSHRDTAVYELGRLQNWGYTLTCPHGHGAYISYKLEDPCPYCEAGKPSTGHLDPDYNGKLDTDAKLMIEEEIAQIIDNLVFGGEADEDDAEHIGVAAARIQLRITELLRPDLITYK